MSIKVLEGHFSAKDTRVGIVVSRFNDFITNKLAEGAVDAFQRNGGETKNLTIIKVPGAFEIPLTCLKAIETGKFDGLVALGAVIRGATPHFDYVSNEVTKGVAQISLKCGVPISFGVLTTDSIEQAIERAGSKAGNKGAESMLGLIEMMDLYKSMGS